MNPRDEKLMRLFDGELDPGAQEGIGAGPAEREKLAALGALGSLIKGTLEAEAAGVNLWDGIEARLPPARRWTSYRAAAVAAALAAAAGLAVMLRPAPPTNHVVVESLEVAGAVATVIDVPDDRGDSTTVIWMDHEESDEWESL